LNPLYLDIILLALGIFIVSSGWRRGLIVSALSLLGLFAGAWLGRSLIEIVTGASTTSSFSRTALSAAALFLGMGFGSALGGFIGNRIRNIFSWSPMRLLDNATGAAVSICAWSIVAWFMATTLLAAPMSSLTNMLNESKVIVALDRYMPVQVRDGVESVRIYVSNSDLPSSISEVLLAPPVEPPDVTTTAEPAIAAALDSVVKVEGTSSECNTRLSGSGFVVGQDLIITNAHVIAGITNPTVRVKGKGKAFEGSVIYFDPANDVALISVSDFPAVALRISEPLIRGDAAVVAAFPGGGPLALIPARVRSVSETSGTDIYGKNPVTREIYALSADIKQGDSGAPMLALDGSVAGLIFASSAIDDQTGYALTAKQFMVAVGGSNSQMPAVSTGECSGVR
jgi:S1-C subfamily serine protease